MRVSETSKKVKTHYEFICYYEGRRVALIGETLEELLSPSARFISWMVEKEFENLFDVTEYLNNKYELNIDNDMDIIKFLLDYNNKELDVPYKTMFIKVINDNDIVEQFDIFADEKDICRIFYNDYLNVLTEMQYEFIINDLLIGSGDDVLDIISNYTMNGETYNIKFDEYYYYNSPYNNQIVSCINEILMTENIRKIDSLGFDDDGLYFDTDKGLLVVPVPQKSE